MQIGKHGTFERNILAVTNSRSLTAAFHGWKVARLIRLTKSRMASCELCGTRFRGGALISFPKKSTATKRIKELKITVGGTCLETIRRAAFGPASVYRQRKIATWRVFKSHYRDEISRGAWLTWMVENAPRRFASLLVDLQELGAVRSDRDMRRLIRFHDAKRLYPVDALIGDPSLLKYRPGRKICEYLTLDEARQLLRKAGVDAGTNILRVRSNEQYSSKQFQRFISSTTQRRRAWDELSRVERRIAIAIAALSGSDRLSEIRNLTANFHTTYRGRGFVWYYVNGVGFVDRPGRSHGQAYVGFFPYLRGKLYEIRDFKSLSPHDPAIADRIEVLAFSSSE